MRGKGLVLLILLMFLLVSCGHKAPPLPPRHLKAVGISSVVVRVRPEETVFLLKISNRYVGAKERVKQVHLVAERCNQDCEKCQQVYSSDVKPGLVVVEDTPLWENRCYKFYGRTDEDVPIGRYVMLLFKRPYPEVPELKLYHLVQDVVAFRALCEQEVALYKRKVEQSYGFIPLLEGRCKKESDLKDFNVKEGVLYCYTARSFVRKDNVYYESLPSMEICVRPKDFTPPPVPRGLTGVISGNKVYLSWDIVKAKDLAGYNVYMKKGGQWIRLNRKPLKSVVFTLDVPAGVKSLVFAVSSVDTKGNESAKSLPVVIKK